MERRRWVELHNHLRELRYTLAVLAAAESDGPDSSGLTDEDSEEDDQAFAGVLLLRGRSGLWVDGPGFGFWTRRAQS